MIKRESNGTLHCVECNPTSQLEFFFVCLLNSKIQVSRWASSRFQATSYLFPFDLPITFLYMDSIDNCIFPSLWLISYIPQISKIQKKVVLQLILLYLLKREQHEFNFFERVVHVCSMLLLKYYAVLHIWVSAHNVLKNYTK